ncbi:MAG: phosphopantetheine-binding protein [bacterium]
MSRADIQTMVLDVFESQFEIANPGLDEDLRDKYDFDSIDAIELLAAVEDYLGRELDQEEKKLAMDIKTINQIIDYVESMQKA